MKKPGQDLEQWVELIEGEADPALRDDLNKLLDHSSESKKTHNDLRRLRGSLKRSDTQSSADFNEELFGRIMSDVGKSKIQPEWQVKLLEPKVYGPIAAGVALAFSTVAVLKNGVGPQPERLVQSSDKSEWIVQESVKSPELLSEAINAHQTEEEMVFDAMAMQLEDLSDEEAKKAMEEMLK